MQLDSDDVGDEEGEEVEGTSLGAQVRRCRQDRAKAFSLAVEKQNLPFSCLNIIPSVLHYTGT